MRTRIVATISNNTIAPERERCVRTRIVATISNNTIAPERERGV